MPSAVDQLMEEEELLPPSASIPTEPESSTPAVLDTIISKSQALNLYTSHLLSTWNARTYEFAAVRPKPIQYRQEHIY
jgi:hypothetical protein